jgi:PAS domain S-box-containing protein
MSNDIGDPAETDDRSTEELSREELAIEVQRLEAFAAGLHKANQDLELLLAGTSAALRKSNDELTQRIAAHVRLNMDARILFERFATLINNIPGVVYRCANDTAWTMEFISDWVMELSGYPASDFINNRVRTFASIIHPDDVSLVLRSVQEGLEKRRPYEIQYRIRHADGSLRHVYEKGQGVFDHQSSFLYLDGVIFDISDGTITGAHHHKE